MAHAGESRPGLVLTVGGANGERVYPVDPADFRLGAKHTRAPVPIMAGGSSLNHSCRLLATGIQAWPVLPVVHDGTGRVLVKALKMAATAGSCKLDTRAVYMNAKHGRVATPFTTILTVGAQRTILNEFPDSLVNAFWEHCQERLKPFAQGGDPACAQAMKADAVIIGHIHGDRQSRDGRPGLSGATTQSVIERFSSQGTRVFVNLGSSQYGLGTAHWRGLLDRIDCFQLDIDEIRAFCSDARDIEALSLEAILDWFKDKCTVVITMERMGAVARLKDSESVVFAWPYDLAAAEIADSTGAGDAFAAGVVASALKTPLDSDRALSKALENGRLCGAYACTTVGGANDCPTRRELDDFSRTHRLFKKRECMSMANARPMLRLLDRIFVRQ